MDKKKEKYIRKKAEPDEVESDLVSFDLVDAKTIKRRIEEGDVRTPFMRTKKYLDIPKDQRWNTKALNSKLLAGILNGDSIPKIATSLQDVIGNNSAAATRNARTIITGAENAGRKDSYEDLEEQGVIQKKVWIATPDDRTRESHLLMDGEEVDIDEPFSNGLMYPADPSGDASEVYNCRCTMRTHIIGFKKADGRIEKVGQRDDIGHEAAIAKEQAEREAEAEAKLREQEAREAENEAKRQQEEERREEIDRQEAKKVETLRKEVTTKLSEKVLTNSAPANTQQEILKSVEKMDAKRLQILNNTADAASVTWVEESGTSHYKHGSGNITLYTQKYGEEKSAEANALTFWHEYGHFADDGYREDSNYTKDIKIGDSTFTVRGIGAFAGKDYNDASARDIERFLGKTGLSDKYEVRQKDTGDVPWIYSKETGEPIDPQGMSFDDRNALSNSVIDWMHEESGYNEATNYLHSLGYPKDPKYTDYMEKYVTPKRHEIKFREKYKGAEEEFRNELRKTSEAQEEWRNSHDFLSLVKTQQEMLEKANELEAKLGFVTDTFDGGAHGAFTCQIIGGHSASYYMQGTNGRNEAVANVFATVMTQDEDLERCMENLCGDTYSLLKGIILNGQKK